MRLGIIFINFRWIGELVYHSYDDDMRVDHSYVTQWSAKCPYKAPLFPYKASKKWEWSAWYFGFVYFTRHRRVTGAKNQSNCIISLKCGTPGFPFLLWFAYLGQNIVIKTTLKFRADHSHFLMTYREKVLPYIVILHVIMWQQTESTHIPSSRFLYTIFWT